MRLSTVAYLHRARLRARVVQELLALAGIAVGVSLLFASQVANTSLSGSVTRLANGLVGAARLQITARDSQGFQQRLLAEVQRLPGVLVAAPVLERSVSLVGPGGSQSVELIGVDRLFMRLKGQLLAHLSAARFSRDTGLALPDPIAEKLGAGALDSVLLQSGARSMHTIVSTTLSAGDIGEVVDSPIAVAPLRLAQRLAGMPGRISRVLVEPLPKHDREVWNGLESVLAERRPTQRKLDVRPANFDAQLFARAEGPTTQSTELFSAISALVGFLFAFNAMLLTAPQRRKLIHDLRLDGYTPLEIGQVLLYDALALGLAGSLLGLLLGDAISRGLLQTNPGYLSFAFPVGSLRIVAWQSVALAFAGGLLAAIVGVFLPLRADAFAGPAPPKRRSPSVRRRAALLVPLLWVLICLTLTTSLLLAGIHSVQTAVVAFVSLVLALLMSLPAVFRVVTAIFDRLQRPVLGVATHLAAIELRSSATRVRSLAVAATGAVAVFGSVAIQGARLDLQHGLDRVSSEITRVSDIWVSPRDASDALSTMTFGGHIGARLAKLQGVAGVYVYRGAFLDIGDRRALVIAPPRVSKGPIPRGQLVKGDIARATARFREGGWLALSQGLAKAYGVDIGGVFTLPAPHPMRLRVAATTTNFGWPPGSVILNADDFARAWGTSDPSAYELALKPGVSSLLVRREIVHMLGQRSPLSVQSAIQRERGYRATQQQGLSRLNDIAALVLIVAAVAMATAMGALIWQRRPRLSSMKIDGFGQGELWRALVCESALLLGTGCSLGAVFGLAGQLVLSRALLTVTGFPLVFAPAVPIAAVIFAVVTVSAVMVVALPGYVAAQIKPALGD